MARVVILLGPPGAGKGTQAARLSARLALPHVATGDLFRENLGQGTALGQKAKSFMESGQLVPDEVVIEMLFERVSRSDCKEGYLLDGFPRTVPQAETFEARLAAGTTVQVANLEVPEPSLVKRAAGRLLCKNCTKIHHAEFDPPATQGVCDVCGGELYTRKDDAPEVLKERLGVYYEQTRPVVDFYEKRGSLAVVDGNTSPDGVFQSLLKSLGEAA